MTGSYRHEIQMLKAIPVDVAFLPLDPRQGSDYANGIRYFLENVEVKKVCPMHYWEEPQTISRFLDENPQYKEKILFTESLRQSIIESDTQCHTRS
jgi:L-ascorbate metabolism protein UlaG (beta-lactamase superfamily)